MYPNNEDEFDVPSLEDSRRIVEETRKGLEQELKNDSFDKEVETAYHIFDECFEPAHAINEPDVPKHFLEATVELNLDNKYISKEIQETLERCTEVEANIRLQQLQKQKKQLEKEIAAMSETFPKLRENFKRQPLMTV